MAGTAEYTLSAMTPAASLFYRLRRVQIEWGSRDIEEINDFTPGEELEYQNFGAWGRWSAKAFRVGAGKLRIRPTPTSAAKVLDDESAEKMIRGLLESFPNIGRNIAAHILVKGY